MTFNVTQNSVDFHNEFIIIVLVPSHFSTQVVSKKPFGLQLEINIAFIHCSFIFVVAFTRNIILFIPNLYFIYCCRIIEISIKMLLLACIDFNFIFIIISHLLLFFFFNNGIIEK